MSKDVVNEEGIMKPVHAMLIIVLVSTLAMTDVKIREPLDATFKALDRHDEQSINREETAASRSLRERLTAADANADGYLDESEYLARPDDRAFRANTIVVASSEESDARSAASAPNIR